MSIVYARQHNRVYFICVSEENQVKVATEPDGFSDSAEVAWLAIDSIKLKGIRSISALKNKYLIVETATQLLSYHLWDVLEPQQKQLDAEYLLESKFKDYSCTEKPSVYPYESRYSNET